MQITCPNCRARYAVDPTAIGPSGRTVECSRCGHRWRERIAQPAPVVPSSPPLPRAIPDLAIRPAPTAPTAVASGVDREATGGRGRWFAAAVLVIAVAGGLLFAFRDDLGRKLPPEWRTLLPFDAARGVVRS